MRHYNAASLRYVKSGLQMRALDDEGVDSIVSDFNVNAISALTMIRAAVPAMKARRSGTLLVTGGAFAFQRSGLFLMLSVDKSALRVAVQALSDPLKEQGIHVASVIGGKVVPPASREAAEVAAELWKLHAQPHEAWASETVY